MIKLVLSFLLLINNVVLPMERIEEGKTFEGASASVFEPRDILVTDCFMSVEQQVKSLLTQRGLRERRQVETAKFRETREGEAIILLAKVIDKKNQLQAEELRMAEVKNRQDQIEDKITRRNNCIVNCCSMAISLGSLGLSVFSTYWSKSHS